MSPLPAQIKIPAAATIAPGMAPSIDDQIAGRVIEQWISVIEAETATTPAHKVFFEYGTLEAIGATPQKQSAWVNKVSARLGERLMRGYAEVAKRCRYKFLIDLFDTMDVPLACLPIGERVDDPSQTVKWLVGRRFKIWRNGVQTSPNGQTFVVACFTKHALVRLLQRAECLNAGDLKTAIVDAWDRVIVAAAAVSEWVEAGRGVDWLVPVRLSTIDPVVFVMGGRVDESGRGLLVIKTVLKIKHIHGDDINAVDALDDYLARVTVEEALGERLKTTQQLISNCQSER